MLDANNADICTIPPSRPIDAPELIENNEEIRRATVGRIEIMPSPIIVSPPNNPVNASHEIILHP